MTYTLKRLVLPAVALATALVLSACGGSDSTGSSMGGMKQSSGTTVTTNPATPTASGTPAAGAHNEADVAFATGMIPHHRQAVSMADLAASRAGSPEVKSLAARIRAAQGPEIARMSGWLAGWGVPVPKGEGMGSMDHSSGSSMGMGSDSGMGMMSDQDMQMLQGASGKDFDVAFLKGMTMHHRGALEMAKTELRDGQNGEAKELAQAIVDSQSREITQMTELLAQLQN